MERYASAARADTAIRSAAFRGLDDERDDGAFAWDLMRTPPATVDALRADINALRDRVAEAAPRRAVTEMDRAITLMNRQVETLKTSGDAARAKDNAAVAEELRKLRVALDGARAPERFHALAAGVDALARKLDALSARAIDPVEVARLQRQTEEMKDLASRALAPGGLKDIAERIAACAVKMERRGEEVARRMSEATSTFERTAESLLSKVSQLESNYILGGQAHAEELRRDVAAEVRTLGSRLDKMDVASEVKALGGRLDQLDVSSEVRALGGRLDKLDVASEVRSINGRLDRMVEQLARQTPNAITEFNARLEALLSRIERVGDVDKAAVEPLTAAVETHLSNLTERVRETQGRLNRLDSLELALDRIVVELARVREAALAAPGEAAQAVVRKVSEDAGGPAVLGIKRGLAALEARQDELERRTGLVDELAGEPHGPGTDLGRAPHNDSLWTPHPAAAAPERHREPHGPHAAPGQAQPHQAHHHQAQRHQPPHHQPQPAPAPHHQAPQHQAQPAPAPSHQAPPAQGPHEVPQPQLHPQPQAQPHPASGAPHAAHPVPPQPQTPPQAAAHQAPQQNPAEAGQAQERAARPRRVRFGSEPDLRAQRGEGEENQEAERPARRVDWTLGTGRRRQPKPAAGNRRALRQNVLLRMLAGGAGMLLLLTAIGLVGQSLPGVAAGMGGMLDRVKAQGASMFTFLSPVRDLPAPIGPDALRTAAYTGDVAAAYAVGVRYADGMGAKADMEAAEKWLAFAVSAGSAPAAYKLGTLYENTTRNYKEAARFYEWAAEQGNVRAMHNLGVLYSQGIDGNPDWQNAIKWFRMSAERGQTDSQYNLGVIFARGLSGQTDSAEAWKWFALAASQGDADSASKRDSLVDRADPQSLARAQREAQGFKPKPLDDGANIIALRPEWEMDAPGAVAGRTTQPAQRAL